MTTAGRFCTGLLIGLASALGPACVAKMAVDTDTGTDADADPDGDTDSDTDTGTGVGDTDTSDSGPVDTGDTGDTGVESCSGPRDGTYALPHGVDGHPLRRHFRRRVLRHRAHHRRLGAVRRHVRNQPLTTATPALLFPARTRPPNARHQVCLADIR